MVDPRDWEGRIWVGDCLEFMRQLPDGCVDLVLTDPPYNVGKNYACGVDDRREDYPEWCDGWLREARRVSPAVLLTPGTKNLATWLSLSEHSSGVFAWFRPNAQSPPSGGNAWMNKWEPVVCFGRLPKKSPWDAWTAKVKFNTGLDHPCVKTDTVWEMILRDVSHTESLVLDPFLGSGTTAVVCERLGRRWLGCEINPEYAEMAQKRIDREREKLQLPFEEPVSG